MLTSGQSQLVADLSKPFLIRIYEVHEAFDVVAVREAALLLAHLQSRDSFGIVATGIVIRSGIVAMGIAEKFRNVAGVGRVRDLTRRRNRSKKPA